MQVIDRGHLIHYEPQVYGKFANEVSLSIIEQTSEYSIYLLNVLEDFTEAPLNLKWKTKAIGVKGAWTTNSILDKRFKTDWEMPKLNSSISNDAPIISLFGHNDENLMTVACSEVIDFLPIEGSLREEDNHFYFNLHFFKEKGTSGDYEVKIFIHQGKQHFSHIVQDLSLWILEAANLSPRLTPALAKVPLYSTWYSFHQNLSEEKLINECQLSKDLGYDLVIIDDGWQTSDNNRGYDYTGDWESVRFSNFSQLVSQIHDIGMAVMLWYSVPFCGKKSKAYQKFKGKFLTENHYWAPVFDPRFPEVRHYLVDIYRSALLEYNIDGFKLDFIDDFKVYPETELEQLDGRDTLSVTQGVFKLIQEIAEALTFINPDVLIEFRQQYINPGLRILGNMFRAFDCPNDSLMNRVRITDVKLICGASAAHSDMITWHKSATVEQAALQFSNLLFAVPQLSVMLAERSEAEIRMIKFFTQYWNANATVLLDGEFTALKPLSNYPILKSTHQDKMIIGLYEDLVLDLDQRKNQIDIINGKMTASIILKPKFDLGEYSMKVIDCQGVVISQSSLSLEQKLHQLDCPFNGMVCLTQNISY